MRIWACDRGEWKEMPSPFGEEESLEESLSALDFDPRPMLSWGDEHGVNVVVRPTVEDIAGVNVDGFEETSVHAEFFVTLNTPSHSYWVFVADLPSLVQLAGELRPILISEREALDFEERNK
jgi:hypothetical protein